MTRFGWVLAGGVALMGISGSALSAWAQDTGQMIRPAPRPMALVAEAAGLPLIRPRTRPQAQPAATPEMSALASAAPRPVAPQAPVATSAALPVLTPPVASPSVPFAAPPAVLAQPAGPDTLRPLARDGVITVSTSGQRLPEPVLVTQDGEAVLVPVAIAAPDTPRARPRPADLAVTPAVLVTTALPRPRARPVALMATLAPATPEPAPALAAPAPEPLVLAGLMRSPRPEARPKGLAKRRSGADEPTIIQAAASAPVKPGKALILPKKGSVCGNPAIRGETLAPVGAKVNGCGIAEPVKVTQVAGVKLSQAALMDCPTALALNKWVESGLQPAFGRNPVVELKVAGHYVCRTRNHKKGAKISEHGKGRAIDISGVTLSNGKTISILKGWRGDYGKALKAAHRAACGTFGTTLGPGSDGYHEDHLHFDTARYRKGPYCR